MSAGNLLLNLIGGAFPENTNPAAGAYEHKPEDMLAHLNSTLDPDEDGQYETAQQARDDGYNIPDHSIWIDKNGNDVTKHALANGTGPMEKPGFFTRAFNPGGAADAQSRNFSYQNAPLVAQQGQDIKRKLLSQELDTLAPTNWATPNDRQASITDASYNGLGAGALENAQTANENIAAGNPARRALTSKWNLEAGRSADVNAYIQSEMAKLLGVPSAQASNSLATTQASTANANSALRLNPLVEQADRLTLGNTVANQSQLVPAQRLLAQSQVQAQQAAQPFNSETMLNEAQRGAGISRTALAQLPYDQQSVANQAVGNAYMTGRLPNPSSPLETLINAREGTVTPGNRAAGYTPFAVMDALANGRTPITKTPIGAIDKSTGQPIAAPPSSFYTDKSSKVIPGTPNVEVTRPVLAPVTGTNSHILTTTPQSAKTVEKKVMSQDELDEASKQVPVKDWEGYTYDHLGNIYYNGEKVHLIQGSLVQAAIDKQMKQKQHQDDYDNLVKQMQKGQSRPALQNTLSFPPGY